MCSYFRRYTTSLLKLTFARRKCWTINNGASWCFKC
jgi:hypothetical protein